MQVVCISVTGFGLHAVSVPSFAMFGRLTVQTQCCVLMKAFGRFYIICCNAPSSAVVFEEFPKIKLSESHHD